MMYDIFILSWNVSLKWGRAPTANLNKVTTQPVIVDIALPNKILGTHAPVAPVPPPEVYGNACVFV